MNEIDRCKLVLSNRLFFLSVVLSCDSDAMVEFSYKNAAIIWPGDYFPYYYNPKKDVFNYEATRRLDRIAKKSAKGFVIKTWNGKAWFRLSTKR